MKRKDWLLRAAVAAVLLVLLLRYPREMTDGIRQGLTLCAFFVRSGLYAPFGRKLSFLMRALFRLPGAAAAAVLLGLCGGYPVGTRMTAELYKAGSLTQSQAQRMCLFCVAAGPAFVSGTVGAVRLGSRALGWLLYASLTLAALTPGILLRYTDAPPQPMTAAASRQPLARSLCESVADAGGSMLSLCAWVLLFSGVCAALRRLPEGGALPLVCLLEVTNGCKAGVEAGLSAPILAAILGFGGVSVHCQVLPDVTACGVPLSRFWAFRTIVGALAAVYCALLLRLFPLAEPVSLVRTDAVVRMSGATAPVSAAMLATAAVFILNTSQPRTDRCKSRGSMV